MNSMITVIIPVYKTEKYLDKCINSIVNQTYKDLEIILVDDESPDKCPQICNEWAQKDKRIKVLHIKNQGVANARNTALKIACGDYISFIDSDDYAEYDMLQILYDSIVKNHSDIAICGFFGSKCDGLTEETDVKKALELISIGDFDYGVLWNKLYRKEILKGVEMPPLVCCEDLVFNFFAFKNAKSISVVPNEKYHYIVHSESVSKRNFGLWAFDAVKSKQIILENATGPLRKYAVKGLVNSCFVVLSGMIQSNNHMERFSDIKTLIKNNAKDIFFSGLYSRREKMKTAVLLLSKKLYIKFVMKGQ